MQRGLFRWRVLWRIRRTGALGLERLAITDKALWEKARACVAEGAPFSVELSGDHRHYDSFVRMLEAVEGHRAKPGLWRSFWDARRAADLVAIWESAVDGHGYRCTWAKYSHALVVTFSPGWSEGR